MKRTTLILIALSAAFTARARFPKAEAERIADAIYIVEGGARAKVPYGILSIKVRNAAEARRICINTIQNNHDRWLKAAGMRSTASHYDSRYLDFLADRYCPPSVDPVGNRNWKHNIKRILKWRK